MIGKGNQMFAIFREEWIVTVCMGMTFALSVLLRLGLGGLYRRLIRETDNMAATNNKLLKQCKLKFTNCFQMNKGMPNIPIFVDKFLSRLQIGPVSFELLYHLSSQLMLLSTVCSGIGVCRSIMRGKMLGQILPFYIVSFLELYLYFSLSALVDVKNYRRVLKINLVDYLENHLAVRIHVTNKDMERLYGKQLQVMPVGGMEAREGDQENRRQVRETEGWLQGPRGRKAEEQGRGMGDQSQEIQGQARETEDRAPGDKPMGTQTLKDAASQSGFTKAQEKELESLLAEFLTS